MKPIRHQHELLLDLEQRPGLTGLSVIRLKGYTASWELGGLRPDQLDGAAEERLRKIAAEMQGEFDMA
jgi:hypothetical protein